MSDSHDQKPFPGSTMNQQYQPRLKCPICGKVGTSKLNIYTDVNNITWQQFACWRELGGCGTRKTRELKHQPKTDNTFDGTVNTRYAKQSILTPRTGQTLYEDDVRRRLLGKIQGRKVGGSWYHG